MSRWWRAYDEAVDDPKLQQLPPALSWAWFNLCCITSQNGGNLPSTEAIAFKLRSTPAKTRRLIADLIQAGLIDTDAHGQRPHNWNARQFKSDTDPTNADRQKRYRERSRNGPNTVTPTVTASVTPTVTDTVTAKRPETESEPERKKDAAGAATKADLERQFFERGKQVCGDNAGGLLAKLLKKQGDVALARATVERASTAQNPREFIGAVIAGGKASPDGRRLTNDEEYWGVGRIPGIV